MTQSQCFDVAINSTSFEHSYSLTDNDNIYYSPSPHNTNRFQNTTSSSSTSRQTALSTQTMNTFKMLTIITTIVYFIFNLPFILTIGYDLLLSIILLAIAPLLYCHRYGFLLHVTAVCSVIYTLRSFKQPHLNPFYWAALMCIFVDRTYLALSNLETHLPEAVGGIISIASTCTILLADFNMTWRSYIDIIWLVVILFCLWKSPT